MNKEFLIKAIKNMDVKSDDFAEVFHVINDKYFTFENPDEFQKAAMLLNAILHKGDEWMVEAMANIGNNLFETVTKKTPAVHGAFQMKDTMYFYDFYNDKDALASLHKMFKNTVLANGGGA